MIISPNSPITNVDAGDTITVIITLPFRDVLSDRHTDAYRLVHNVTYPTTYYTLNTSSIVLLVGLENSPSDLSAVGSYNYDEVAGAVQFMTDELIKTQFLQAVMDFELNQAVNPGQNIEIGLSLTWSSLPHGITGDRSYETTETHIVKRSLVY